MHSKLFRAAFLEVINKIFTRSNYPKCTQFKHVTLPIAHIEFQAFGLELAN